MRRLHGVNSVRSPLAHPVVRCWFEVNDDRVPGLERETAYAEPTIA